MFKIVKNNIITTQEVRQKLIEKITNLQEKELEDVYNKVFENDLLMYKSDSTFKYLIQTT